MELAGREAAQATDAAPEILLRTLVPIAPALDAPGPYRRVSYRIRSRPGTRLSPAPTPSARASETAPGTWVVESLRRSPDAAGLPIAGEERARALGSSLLIEADDPAIRAAAREAAGDATDPWEKAVRLERWVARTIEEKSLRVIFASAARTLASREGDCTEHAVLLAALARASGLPARVAAGLVAVGGSMGFHLWTEVDAGRGWIGLDAALDRAPVDGRYLPLAVSDLADGSLTPLVLGILDAVSGLEIEILEVETDAPEPGERSLAP
jgi:transglutaminase-like putative cysteine protease